MTTRETLQDFFDKVQRGTGWDSRLADDVVFTSFTSPVRRLAGKEACLKALQRFYSTVASFAVREMIIDGDKACVTTHYELRVPGGGVPFESDVAEVFSVRRGQIASFGIYFDTAPYPK